MKKNEYSKDVYIFIYLTSLIFLASQFYFLHTLTALSILIFVLKSNYKKGIIIYCSTLIWTLETYSGFNDYILIFTQVIMILKSLKEIYTKKFRFSLIDIGIILLFTTYTVISFILYYDFSVFKIILSFTIFIMFIVILKNSKDDGYLYGVFYVYLVSINLAILYGYLTGNFLETRSIEGVFSNLRFSGVHAPNYMAFYINIGICMLLFSPIQNSIKKTSKIVLFFNMSTALFLTQSTTATALFIVLLLVRVFVWLFTKKSSKKLLLQSALVLFILAISFLFIERFTRVFVQTASIQRLLNRIDLSNQFNLNTLTNNRFDSWQFYLNEYFNGNFFNEVFGRAIFNPYSYYINSDFFSEESLIGSHSTFIDMLWAVGIVGILSFILFNLLRINENRNSSFLLAIVMMKIVLIISMFSTSLMSNRLFFFLLLL